MVQENARQGDWIKVICMAPDVCLTKVGSAVIPIPYQITDVLDDSKNVTGSVFFTKEKAFTIASFGNSVAGDGAGTDKGIKSGTTEGKVEYKIHCCNVRVEGEYILRHGDICYMNNKNTIGKIKCSKDMKKYLGDK